MFEFIYGAAVSALVLSVLFMYLESRKKQKEKEEKRLSSIEEDIHDYKRVTKDLTNRINVLEMKTNGHIKTL